MKTIILVIITMFLFQHSAQSENYVITRQSQLDSFKIQHSSSEFTGNIIIKNIEGKVTNTDSLSHITKIEGGIQFYKGLVPDLSGFDNLIEVDSLSFVDNRSNKKIEGFTSVERISNSLSFEGVVTDTLEILNKLEYLLVQVNKKGFYADTFHIMSGYRTPYYNKMLGNVELSRHVFGDAADIYIDVNPRDGQMDDLNGDGRVNIKDANLLYNTVEESYNNREYKEYIGGLGLYRKTSSHSPFIHIDTRGYKARW